MLALEGDLVQPSYFIDEEIKDEKKFYSVTT